MTLPPFPPLDRARRGLAAILKRGKPLKRRPGDGISRAMNRMDFPSNGGEAEIRYLDADFTVVRPGTYVRCAITGRPILIQDLRYWNVERQEPYLDAEAALEAYRRYEKR